ncbi:translation initiation factor IF-2-like [Corvus hawaiiensis]|uniref:translation initiation factor IF-2-like n=1 Tax=Corvus hawaiiensis TaxID=134902 RepID=UPI002018F6E6|nr:translation initiation factor IF-2-like [Corvus hawaiiensis]
MYPITTTLCPQHTLSPRCSNPGTLRRHGTLLGTMLHPQHTLSPRWSILGHFFPMGSCPHGAPPPAYPVPVVLHPCGSLSPWHPIPTMLRPWCAPPPRRSVPSSVPILSPRLSILTPLCPRDTAPRPSPRLRGGRRLRLLAGARWRGASASSLNLLLFLLSLREDSLLRGAAAPAAPRHGHGDGHGTGTGTARGAHGTVPATSGAMCATRVPRRCPRVPGPVRPPRATLQVPPAGDGAWARARAARADPGGLRVPALPQRREGRGPGHPLTQRLRGWEKREQQRDGAREPVAITTPVPGWGRCSEPGTGTPGTGTPGTGPARAQGDRGPLTLSPDFGLPEDTGLCWCLSLLCPQPGGHCAVPQG